MLRIFQGNTLGPLNILVRDLKTKLPVDLTGVTVIGTVKADTDIDTDTITDAAAALKLTAIVNLDQFTNKGRAVIPVVSASSTMAMVPGRYSIDLKFIKGTEYTINSYSIPFIVLAPNTRRS